MLNPEEIKGLDWIKSKTPTNARVQIEPEVRGRDTWAYVPAFGERRMSGGEPIGMIPLAKYQRISARIRKDVYLSTSAGEAHEGSLGLCIDYLVIGQPERTAYPKFQQLIDESPHLFTPAFRNDALAVYAVSGSWERQGCRH
jgi:hypothetical protein